MIVGNDIAKYQGQVDFNVYKNNSNFVIIKATEGSSYVDPTFQRNQAEARRVGLPLGYYHFARPDLGNSPEVEADFYLKTLGEVRDGEVLTLDYECPNQQPSHVEWCRSFMNRVATKLNGLKCLIYLNQAQVTQFDWTPVVNAGHALWIACYTYDPNKNNFKTGAWKSAAIQQWSNRQQVPGIPTPADGDVFFGDLASFKKFGKQPSIPSIDPNTQKILELTKQLEEANKTIASLKVSNDTNLAALRAECQKKGQEIITRLQSIEDFIVS